jgi:hypothetical protein
MTTEKGSARGRFSVWFTDATGREQWRNEFDNVVTTVGKNLALDTYLAGSAYTVTGPFMGLISSVSFSATAAGDTMASHAGWTEAGAVNAPSYTVGGSAVRGTPAWSAASGGSKATSAAVQFQITQTGTVEGAFLVYGSGAVNTQGSTAGTLYSAGVFSGGAQPVTSGGTLSVTYTASI